MEFLIFIFGIFFFFQNLKQGFQPFKWILCFFHRILDFESVELDWIGRI